MSQPTNTVTHARVPEHVVHRSFVRETVVLNLQSGTYHGLNPTGGHMLEVLERVGSLERAAEILAADYELSVEEIGADLRQFCDELASRNLLELDDSRS